MACSLSKGRGQMSHEILARRHIGHTKIKRFLLDLGVTKFGYGYLGKRTDFGLALESPECTTTYGILVAKVDVVVRV